MVYCRFPSMVIICNYFYQNKQVKVVLVILSNFIFGKNYKPGANLLVFLSEERYSDCKPHTTLQNRFWYWQVTKTKHAGWISFFFLCCESNITTGRSFSTELHMFLDETRQLLNPFYTLSCCCFVTTESYSAAHPGFELVIPFSRSLK